MTSRPTLGEIRSWPAAVSIAVAATAYGISRSHAYELAARNEFPARTIRAGARWVVVTASIIQQLSASEQASDAA
jgi:predicted DNA-binding transcriptional regulator AlpA